MLVEAAIDTPEAAARAVAEGAQRLELCGDLSVGGVTPPPPLLDECGSRWGVPVAVMIRPRGGDFVYSAYELSAMNRSMARARDAGASAVVLGALRANRTIDEYAMRFLADAAGDLPIVFHRAFDATRHLLGALETLCALGITRVLTGGGPGDAFTNRATIAHLIATAGQQIEILAGGGVRAVHVRALVHDTGVTQVHARGTEAGVIGALAAALRP